MKREIGGLLAGLAIVVASGCSDATGVASGSAQVSVRMAAVVPTGAEGSVDGDALVMTGSNGTLRIDQLFIIMDEFELKRVDDDQCVEEDDSCEKFRAGPELLDVPLDGSGVIAVQQAVDTGTYRRLEFEVDDLDDDEENAEKAARIAALRNEIRAQFPDWPNDASMVVIGTFTPEGGAAVAFRAYFEAEVEVEMQLQPPVVIEASATNPSFTVRIDPMLMFRHGDGSVRNLAQLDFAATGSVLEFEVEIENGITEVEFDD